MFSRMITFRKRSFLAAALLMAATLPAASSQAEEFEAESALLSGVSSKTHAGASGGYRVAYFDQEGDSIFFDAVPDGAYLEIAYSLGLGTDKQCSVYVNGLDAATATFAPTGSWDSYATVLLTLDVAAGSLRLQLDFDDMIFNAGESCASIDKIAVLAEPPPEPGLWRSSLYPEDWTPGFADAQGRFLHDFSYAGYHKGEALIPAPTTRARPTPPRRSRRPWTTRAPRAEASSTCPRGPTGFCRRRARITLCASGTAAWCCEATGRARPFFSTTALTCGASRLSTSGLPRAAGTWRSRTRRSISRAT